MWKSASRSIKSIFCKQQCSHNNVTTREARYNKRVNCFRNLSPALFSNSNRSFGSESQKKKSFAQNDKENPETGKKSFLNELPNLLSVLSLSGLCALGLYIIEPFHPRKVTFSQEWTRKSAFDIFSRFTLNDYLQVLRYFTNIQFSLHVLPKTETKRENKDKIYNRTVNEIKFDELEKAHKLVVGSLCNFRGADCMNKGNYTEAILHFEEAADVQNPAGTYNLGVCYEIGLGTNQDFKKAAEMYKRASDLGHPAATYNLGVFYVHGMGDLKTDLSEARKLFQIAASQGQPNAQVALDMENSKETKEVLKFDGQVEESESENSMNIRGENVEFSSRKRNNFGKFNLFCDNVLNFVKYSKADLESASSDDSGALDLSPKDQVLFS